MNDIIQMPKGNYVLKNAVYADTGRKRLDGWYPEWVGMTMQFRPIPIGWIAQFRYVKDNDGNPYYGGMHTSPVVSVDIATDESIVEIKTMNTLYTFEKEVGKCIRSATQQNMMRHIPTMKLLKLLYLKKIRFKKKILKIFLIGRLCLRRIIFEE